MPEPDLRERRLVFYREEVDRIDRILEEFLQKSQARCVFLVDREGHLITKRGLAQSIKDETVSALVAGSFAATREMARILGEDEFAILFHQGKKDSIQLNQVCDRAILAIMFDDRTTAGMVRLYASEAAGTLGQVFEELEVKSRTRVKGLTEEFGREAKHILDDLFGEQEPPKEGIRQ